MVTEQSLIERIARSTASKLARRNPSLRLAIGDDAVVLRLAGGRELVWSCDQFLEGVHFLTHVHPPEAIGYKALARAASDLAAMGAQPRFFLLSLALPAGRTSRWLDAFLKGLGRAARRFGIALAGGDTSQHSSLAIDVNVLGEMKRGVAALTRRGARPGDLVYLSGTPGQAQLGLEMMLRGLSARPALSAVEGKPWQPLLHAHLHPEPRLALGQWLAKKRIPSAMLDTSDGLSTDLANLCRASGVGAILWQESIPLPRVPPELLRRGLDPLHLALHGGEDYELLFTVPRRRAGKLPSLFKGIPLTSVGEITSGRGLRLRAGNRLTPLVPRGWDHFRKQ